MRRGPLPACRSCSTAHIMRQRPMVCQAPSHSMGFLRPRWAAACIELCCMEVHAVAAGIELCYMDAHVAAAGIELHARACGGGRR
mmetsp:Transcript_2450/g.6557  ORF Transcript_2450/g.6557 Transcript_2450/m.6557 type:complete len:85 (+) Transcript_2450:743-997(+)